MARIQQRRDQDWREIEGYQEEIQGIASQGINTERDFCLSHMVMQLVARELAYRQALRCRIDRGELDNITDD